MPRELNQKTLVSVNFLFGIFNDVFRKRDGAQHIEKTIGKETEAKLQLKTTNNNHVIFMSHHLLKDPIESIESIMGCENL